MYHCQCSNLWQAQTGEGALASRQPQAQWRKKGPHSNFGKMSTEEDAVQATESKGAFEARNNMLVEYWKEVGFFPVIHRSHKKWTIKSFKEHHFKWSRCMGKHMNPRYGIKLWIIHIVLTHRHQLNGCRNQVSEITDTPGYSCSHHPPFKEPLPYSLFSHLAEETESPLKTIKATL